MSTLSERIAAHKAGKSGLAARIAASRRTTQQPTVAEPEKEPEPWYEDLGEGVAVSGMDTYYGVKDLFTDLTDEDKATLKDWKEDAAESGWGTAGRVLGEIGQLAIPGAAATKGLRAAAAAAKLAKGAKAARGLSIAAPVVGDVAATALHGAVKLPGEGETRLQSAAQEGAMGLLGGAIGAGLGKAVKGIKTSRAAKKLMDEGTYLTPGQASRGKTFAGLENVMDVVPGLARGTQAAQERAARSFTLKAIKEAAPEGVDITRIGTKGYQQLKKGVDDAYAKAWAKVDEVPEGAVEDMLTHIDDITPTLPIDDARVLNGVAGDVLKLLDDVPGPRAATIFDDVLRRKLSSAASAGKRDLADEIGELRAIFRQNVSPEAAKALRKVDAKYPAFLTIQRAAAAANKTGGLFTPAQLSDASKQVGGLGKAAGGKSPLYKTASRGMETAARAVGGEDIIGRFRRLAASAPSPLPMQTMGQYVLGRGPGQRPLQEILASPLARELRDYVSPARLGAAYEE